MDMQLHILLIARPVKPGPEPMERLGDAEVAHPTKPWTMEAPAVVGCRIDPPGACQH